MRLLVTPQRTADKRLVAPTPIIAPVMIAAHSMGLGMGINSISDLPDWVAFSCFTAISLGTMSGGWKIVKTMGTRITKVTPLEGMVAETAGAFTLYITEMLKIPVSTTHTIAAAMIPITFCESFRPCPTLNMAEETNCNLLNHISAVCGFARRQM